jgi:hypothetical protein
MPAQLVIESSLNHDGDGLVRYVITASNDEFSASTLAWGNLDDHLAFADALSGFPSSSTSTVSYTFGSPGMGTCALKFLCRDNLGHLGVWAAIESPDPVGREGDYERASLFVPCEPNDVDGFVASLRAFGPGSTNQARLLPVEP